MARESDKGLLLGRETPVPAMYSPDILHPIPRQREEGDSALYGADQWHAYELSWLDAAGKPEARVGRFVIPAESPNIVESKSFKLYLNSLNGTRFHDQAEFTGTVVRDIGAAAGAEVSLELMRVDDPAIAGVQLAGHCIDDLDIGTTAGEPSAQFLLLKDENPVEEQLYSHLLRSLCPVTGQPDWATVWIHYRGAALDHASLLAYLVSYRQHQDFHEHCAERIFGDLRERCQPEFLHMQAFYTRRGGLDISPFRSTDPGASPLGRLARQ